MLNPNQPTPVHPEIVSVWTFPQIVVNHHVEYFKHMTGIINEKPVAPWLAPALFEAVGR